MKKRDKYLFPAVFTYEEGYEIAVTFPDLPGCATCGADEAEAFSMAQEALGLHLWGMEKDEDEIPAPTPLKDVELEPNEHAVLVEVFMPAVRLSQTNKAVNRTVTIPAWLNAEALSKSINFSQVLQKALIDQLNIPQ